MAIRIVLNGRAVNISAASDVPLLYVLRNELEVMTPKFGCGMAQCGACSVLVDGVEVRSCITPIGSLDGKDVVTVEGLPGRWAQQQGLLAEEAVQTLHPIQQAWIEQQVPQCGICQFGMMIKVTELLESNPSPSDVEIREALTTSGPSPHLCRCGSYVAIMDGVRHAAGMMRGKGGQT